MPQKKEPKPWLQPLMPGHRLGCQCRLCLQANEERKAKMAPKRKGRKKKEHKKKGSSILDGEPTPDLVSW